MTDSQSDRRHRRLSAGDRHWIASLTFAVLFVVAGAVVVGWTIPHAMGHAASPLAALIFVAWVVISGVACLLIGRGPARGDEIARRALARDWDWPDRTYDRGTDARPTIHVERAPVSRAGGSSQVGRDSQPPAPKPRYRP